MAREIENGYSDRNTRLTEVEVRQRLASYIDTGVTDELYNFGQMMVEKALARFNGLDTKATAIAAYSIGIITLLASTQGSWVKALQSWAILPVLSAFAAFGAAAFAVAALLLKKSNWFSQDEWLNEKHIADVEALRRYHIINMWGVLSSHQAACDSKAARIALAEASLLASAVLLLPTLVAILVN